LARGRRSPLSWKAPPNLLYRPDTSPGSVCARYSSAPLPPCSVHILQEPAGTRSVLLYEVTPQRLERGDHCWLFKLMWMETQRVQMKGVLPWLVCWACRDGTRDFSSALAALVGSVTKYFFLTRHYCIQISLSQSPCKPCWVACLRVTHSWNSFFFPISMSRIR
jgi:hypothetical protein